MIISKRIARALSVAFMCVSMSFVVACGEEEEEEEEAAGALDGTWVGDCSYNSGDDESEVETLVFSGTSFTRSADMFSGDGCVAANQFLEMSMSGSLVYGEGNAIDITPTTTDITFKNADMIANVNAENMFGHSDWEVDVAKTFTEATADVDWIDSTMYEIYEISGSNLCFGAEVDDTTGDTAETRPTEIDSTDCLTKQ